MNKPLVILSACILLSLLFSSTAIAQSPDVFATFIDSGITHYVGGTGLENYSKIQDAIDNSSEGDTIFVYNGKYQENLVIPWSIRLIGENRKLVVIDGGNKTDTIAVWGDGVVIANVTIQHSGNFDAGVKINTDGNHIENCTIFDCWDGVELNAGGYNQIVYCEIAYNQWSGVSLLESIHTTIRKCCIHDNADGVLMEHSSLNIIENCNISSNVGEGIEIEQCSKKNIFSHNKISSNDGYGVFLYWGSDDTYISHCLIADNNVGITIGSIFLGGGNNTAILSNNITNNVDSGILFLGDGSSIKGTHVHFNNIYGNVMGLSARTAQRCFVHAERNWWGSKLGPSRLGFGSGDRISWNRFNSRIYLRPWLRLPEKDQWDTLLDILPDYELNVSKIETSVPTFSNISNYSWSDTTLYVGGTGLENYSKIQDAIDNSSEGDTIFVYNGKYQENLVIPWSIRLIGENRKLVVIDGGNKTDTIAVWGDGVVIANVTIQHSGNFDAGVKINTDGNHIENCTIFDCWDGVELNAGGYNQIVYCEITRNGKEGAYLFHSYYNIISHCSMPYNQESIWLDSSDYNTFKNCVFEGNREEGIQIRDSSHNSFLSCEISSNIFGYGLYVQCNSDCNIIQGCEIRNNGVGLFFSASKNRGPNGSNISFCNIVDNAGTGIFFLGDGTLMDDTEVHLNNVYGNKKGVMVTNAPSCFVHAEHNWWGSKRGPSLLGLRTGDRINWAPFNSRIYFYPWLESPVDI